MSAFVNSNKEPHVAPGSPVATSFVGIVGGVEFSVWDPSASRFQIGLVEDFWDVYMMPSTYGFTFDSHVHDLSQGHYSAAHVSDSVYGGSLGVVRGSKLCNLFELLLYEIYTPATFVVGFLSVW